MMKYISSVPKISAKWALTGEHTSRWRRIWSSWAAGPPRSACLIFPAGNDTFPDGPDRSRGRGDHHQRFIWVLATNNHMWSLHLVILFTNFLCSNSSFSAVALHLYNVFITAQQWALLWFLAPCPQMTNWEQAFLPRNPHHVTVQWDSKHLATEGNNW